MHRRLVRLRLFAALGCAVACLAACTTGSSPPGSTAPSQHRSGDARQQQPGGGGDGDAEADDAERRAEARGQELPEDSFLLERLMPSGVPDAAAFDQAAHQAARIRTASAAMFPDRAERSWTFLGPSNVGGRVVDAAADPDHSGTLYVATATNGIWKSTDGGQTFSSAWPVRVTHAMGAVAIGSDGNLFAGTGETNPGGGSITYGGSGVYRSTDGGQTWHRVGLSRSGTIGRIVVDPSDPQRIWVAVSGNLFVPGGQRGVYVSTDGGDTWKRSLAPPNDTTGAADLAVDPHDPDHVIATMWDHFRKPGTRIYTGVGSGMWQTRNGGATWHRLVKSDGVRKPAKNVGRIGVAFAPSDPSRVYAIYANNGLGYYQDFFTSTDNGRTWQRPAGAADLVGSQSVYGWWFGRVFVDPTDPDRVDVSGLDMSESTNGAKSFSTLCCLHSDQHIMIWDPTDHARVYVGNDGGLYASTAGGASGTFTQSDDQPWSQYQDVDVSDQDPSRFVGGLQDNGTVASWTTPPFSQIYGGDGQRALINPTNENNYYACAQYGACSGFDDGQSFNLNVISQRFPYFMQMELQPGDPSVLYAGGNELNRSTDGGRTFTALTADLGHGRAGHDRNPLYRDHYGTISAIGVSASDPDTIWVGTDNGYLDRSTDGGSSFVELPPPVEPRLWISRITVDPRNADVVYVAFSGYRKGKDAPYILRTTDGGSTWTTISANLPHAPVDDVVVVGKDLYAATDVGVFWSPKRDVQWHSLGTAMPNLVVTDLRYEPTNGRLYASTFGMGVWAIRLS